MAITMSPEALIRKEKEGLDLQLAYRSVFQMLDVTTLEGTDDEGTLKAICRNVLEYSNRIAGGIHIAAVCSWPVYAGLMKEALYGSGIRTACVSGAFPSGQSPMDVRLLETRMALEAGAQEIDMVISRGRFLRGDEQYMREEISSFANLCRGMAKLKVILETGELKEERLIRRASRIALEEGADFIKTSTGKIQPGATKEAFFYMLQEIKTFSQDTGEFRGIKAAGGISDPETALDYWCLTRAVLGEEWLVPERLRFGASRLAATLFSHLSQP
jgi:deoxyribose-phosphate aldolase